MPDIVIRTALPAERHQLERLQRRASLGNPGDREALLANPDAIELPVDQLERGNVFIAQVDGSVAGFAAIVPREDGDIEVDGLFVTPDMWGRGIGRALLDHCASIAQADGSGALHVVANPHARGFYEACGFIVVGDAQTRFGPAWSMTRSLSQGR